MSYMLEIDVLSDSWVSLAPAGRNVMVQLQTAGAIRLNVATTTPSLDIGFDISSKGLKELSIENVGASDIVYAKAFRNQELVAVLISGTEPE